VNRVGECLYRNFLSSTKTKSYLTQKTVTGYIFCEIMDAVLVSVHEECEQIYTGCNIFSVISNGNKWSNA
jgi:hypothetical protein